MTGSGVTSELCDIVRGASCALPAGEDGERILDAARRHRVDRLVAWRTRRVDDGMRAQVVLDEVRVRDLNRVLAGLEARGVAPLVLKGAALAHTHYEQSWLRPRLDADILIPEDGRQRAYDVLRELGYSQPPFTSGSLVMRQTQFVRAGIGGDEHVLDVHWRIANDPLVADFVTYDELASRAYALAVRGQSMRTPGAVDALLLACVHRAVHHGNADDLLWIYDIHLLAERLTVAAWRDVLERASARGVTALCADGLRTSVDRFQTAVPPDILCGLDRNGARTEPSAVYVRKDLRRVDRLLLDLRALGPRAGLRLMWEHLVPPADYMRQRYHPRSRVLLPAFYVRRVVEGMTRWFARADPAG